MTNDLISRKDLLGMFEHHTWFFTSDIINNINSAPAIQQCGDGEPIGKYNTRVGSTVIYNHKKLQNDFGLTELPLFTHSPDQTAKIKELSLENITLATKNVALQEEIHKLKEHITKIEYMTTPFGVIR